jgi:hypothetical protein
LSTCHKNSYHYNHHYIHHVLNGLVLFFHQDLLQIEVVLLPSNYDNAPIDNLFYCSILRVYKNLLFFEIVLLPPSNHRHAPITSIDNILNCSILLIYKDILLLPVLLLPTCYGYPSSCHHLFHGEVLLIY